MIEQIFFELIRVAIGSQDTLSRPPSAKDWQQLYDMAKKQSLVGICFAAVQKTLSTSPFKGESLETSWNLPEVLYLQWLGMSAKIQQRNEVVNRQCIDLQKKLEADGIRSSVLKGQAVGQYYGQLAALRQSGDIDIYMDCGRKKAIEYARTLQDQVDWDYKHLHLHVFPDTEVEMHYVPEVFLNLWKNRKLQKWFKDHQEEMFKRINLSNSSKPLNISTPSIEFNLFYILLHTYRHFLYEGVGLRQLMDYYFVLRASYENDNTSTSSAQAKNENLVALFEQFGMMRFAKGVMWIMAHVFANVNTSTSLAQAVNDDDNFFLGIMPDEKEGRYILEQVMMGGNFGHHDERLQNSHSGKWSAISKILKHNLHLLAHYPSDVIWAPIWIVYHKMWKLKNR